jgi:DNA-binding NarL/FixJ family response regulator
MLRRRWARELRRVGPISEAADRFALERRMLRLHPAVVFLDLDLPGLGGVKQVAAIARLCPPAKIVLLTGAPDEQEAVFALLAGARGYCDRAIRPPLIRKAAEAVQRGEIWIARHLVPHLVKRLSAAGEFPGVSSGHLSPDAFPSLGRRERQIARLVGVGATNKEIATHLNITPATVKAHLTSVYHKLNVPDRLRLALFLSGHPVASLGPLAATPDSSA